MRTLILVGITIHLAINSADLIVHPGLMAASRVLSEMFLLYWLIFPERW